MGDMGDLYREHKEFRVTDCPPQGVADEDRKGALHYRHIAYIEEYPDEGVMGLGPELDAKLKEAT